MLPISANSASHSGLTSTLAPASSSTHRAAQRRQDRRQGRPLAGDARDASQPEQRRRQHGPRVARRDERVRLAGAHPADANHDRRLALGADGRRRMLVHRDHLGRIHDRQLRLEPGRRQPAQRLPHVRLAPHQLYLVAQLASRAHRALDRCRRGLVSTHRVEREPRFAAAACRDRIGRRPLPDTMSAHMVETRSSGRAAVVTGAVVFGLVAAIGGTILMSSSVGPSGIVPGAIIGLIVGVVLGAALGMGTSRMHT